MKMKSRHRHCKTVKLFAGIDLHKERFNVHIIDENERKVDRGKLTTAEESIRSYFSMYVGQSIEVAVEVGNPTFRFCDILESMGFSYRIVNQPRKFRKWDRLVVVVFYVRRFQIPRTSRCSPSSKKTRLQVWEPGPGSSIYAPTLHLNTGGWGSMYNRIKNPLIREYRYLNGRTGINH